MYTLLTGSCTRNQQLQPIVANIQTRIGGGNQCCFAILVVIRNERELFIMKKYDFNFRLVLASQIISIIGVNMLNFALALFILNLTQSAGTFGVIMAMSTIPVFVLSLPAGIMADRLNKKKMIVVLDAAKAVLGGILILIFLTNGYSVVNLAALILLLAVSETLFRPVLTSATPTLVKADVLVEANGTMQGINAMADLFSVVLGGLLFTTIGISWIIISCTILFMISTIIDLFIKIPFSPPEKTNASVLIVVKADLKEGFHYITKENPLFLKIPLVGAVVTFFLVPIISVAAPYIIRIEFAASEGLFGLSQAMFGVGMLLGSMLIGKVKPWLRIDYFFKWLLAISGVCLMLVGSLYVFQLTGLFHLSFWLFNIGIMLMAVIITFISVTSMSRIQGEAPSHLLGKIFGILMTINQFTPPIGQLVVGQVLEIFSDYKPLLFIGIATIFILISVITKKVFPKGT